MHSLALALLSLATCATATTPDQTTNATLHLLTSTDPEALCLNGAPATIALGGPDPTPGATWVLQLADQAGGQGIQGVLCIQAAGCNYSAAVPIVPPPATQLLSISGPQSPNCTINPTFCNATQAQLNMCDSALLLGNTDAVINGTTARFRGRRILKAAISFLVAAGLSGGSRLLLTGFGHGGTAAILNADYVASLLPATVEVKALGADALKPKFEFFNSITDHTDPNGWYPGALDFLAQVANLSLTTSAGLWMNVSLPQVQTPLMLVQQTPSVWDYQCIDHARYGALPFMIDCDDHHEYEYDQYICTQYPDLCRPDLVKNYTIPLQLAYKQQNTMATGSNNGAFFFQCYLGAYWGMTFECGEGEHPAPDNCARVPRQHDGVWNQISVAGTTMRQAVSDWWDGKQAVYYDDTWDASATPPTTDDGPIVGAPIVPWYTSHYFTNPTCRGYPWY